MPFLKNPSGFFFKGNHRQSMLIEQIHLTLSLSLSIPINHRSWLGPLAVRPLDGIHCPHRAVRPLDGIHCPHRAVRPLDGIHCPHRAVRPRDGIHCPHRAVRPLDGIHCPHRAVRPLDGIHCPQRTSLLSLSVLLQLYPECLACLIWML